MSLTRTAIITLTQGARTAIGVGRVKTPTMAIVCRRELEIRDFVVQPYFEVVATATVADGCFRMRCAPKERISDRAAVEAIAAIAAGANGPLAVRVEEKRQLPPRLHDLPSLQKLCASRFGWLAGGNPLPARKPDPADDADRRRGIGRPKICGDPGARSAADPARDGWHLQRQRAGRCQPPHGDPERQHDRHPEASLATPNCGRAPPVRRDRARHLAALMPDFRYRQTTASLDLQEHAFRAVGRQPIELGWRAAFPDWTPAEEKGDETQLLPALRNGEGAVLSDPVVEAKETRPPPRYNEGTLIDAMQNAWRFVGDEALRERLKEAKGIGTPATRAEIIRVLKAQELLTAQGKNIVLTERGLALFNVLQRADPALVDPGVTAQLERLLDEVLIGQTEMTCAIYAVYAQASRIIGRLTEHAASGTAPLVAVSQAALRPACPVRPPTPAIKAYVVRLAQQQPNGYVSSSAICRAFLNKHAVRKGPTDAKTTGIVQ